MATSELQVTRRGGFARVASRPTTFALPTTDAASRLLNDPRSRRLLSRAGTCLAFLLLFSVVALIAFRAAYSGRVYPAVQVAGVAVGGDSPEDARAAVASMAADMEQGSFLFTVGERSFAPTLAELGISVDVDRSVDRAFALGRGASAADRVAWTLDLIRADQQSPLYVSFDQTRFQLYLDGLDREIGPPPQNATIAVRGSSVSIIPEVDGLLIDRAATETAIRTAISELSPVSMPLPTVAFKATVRSADLAGIQSQIAAALERPIKVAFEGEVWDIAPAEIGQFVVLREDPALTGAAAVSIDLDRDRLVPWLDETFRARIDREPVDALVGWNGGPVAIEPSIDGVRLRPTTLADEVSASFTGARRTVQVPVNVVAPTVDSDNLAALGLTTLLARGTSNYDGSTYDRSTNIAVGASLMNGTLVPPGGLFSFNGAIGEITEDKGYVEAKVIQAERIGKDIGGGICQVSTTVFRAALLAGLPIEQWWPHTYRISYYERDGWGPGYDASILQIGDDPSQWGDFTFRNPSDSWLLVESWATGVEVVVNLYGADLGFDAQLTETETGVTIPIDPDLEVVNEDLDPGTIEHTELPEEGIEVWFVRDVYDQDGTLVESRKFRTVFHSRGNVWQVSPDMRGQSPAGGG